MTTSANTSSWSRPSRATPQDISFDISTEELLQKSDEYLRGRPTFKYKAQKIRSPKYYGSRQYPKKEYFSANDLLEVVDELLEKEIGNIFIGGSLSLFLQGKLDRCEFKDLDLIYQGNLELDEDIEDYNSGSEYPESKNLKSVIYQNTPIDLFKEDEIEFVMVNYQGKTYKCQRYKKIIEAKLKMSLKDMKDKDYLFNNFIEIKIK